MDLKCSTCKQIKDSSEFARNKSKKLRGGFGYECKPCHNMMCQKHYIDNKQRYLDRNAVRHDRIMSYITKLKNDNPCLFCGEKEHCCLDFHHIDPSLKDHAVSYMLTGRWCFDKIKREIEKCVLLCSNCHRKLHNGLLSLNEALV